MRIDCLVGNVPLSFFESRCSSSVRVVSPSEKREKYDFKFDNFTQFNNFLRKRLGYEKK